MNTSEGEALLHTMKEGTKWLKAEYYKKKVDLSHASYRSKHIVLCRCS